MVAYQYDAAGNRTRITYPDTKQVNYTFDGASRMDTVTDWASNVTDYAYDDVGRLTTTTLPNGVVQTSSYNNADQLTDIEAVKGGTTLTDFAYGLDNAGMRTSVVTPAGTESCTYDNLYRLTGVTYPDTSTQVYTYDAVGNRLTKVQGSTTSYTYDNADRMTAAGGVTYTYDNNGNQTGRGSDLFGWDIEDRLTSATVGGTGVTYAYRGDDLRHSKTLGGVTTVYAWDLSAQLPVVAAGGQHHLCLRAGVDQPNHRDHHQLPAGRRTRVPAALTDASGAVTATYAYDVFGAVKSSTGPGSTEFRFAGQQDDPALGYQYLRARYYDPSTGRFISKERWNLGPWRQTNFSKRCSKKLAAKRGVEGMTLRDWRQLEALEPGDHIHLDELIDDAPPPASIKWFLLLRDVAEQLESWGGTWVVAMPLGSSPVIPNLPMEPEEAIKLPGFELTSEPPSANKLDGEYTLEIWQGENYTYASQIRTGVTQVLTFSRSPEELSAGEGFTVHLNTVIESKEGQI